MKKIKLNFKFRKFNKGDYKEEINKNRTKAFSYQ